MPDGGPGDASPDGGPTTTQTSPSPDAGPLSYSWPPSREGYVNPIPAENAKPGDPSWQKGFTNAFALQIEAYADHVSASPGDAVKLMVRSAGDSTASWALYRIGWYNGAGARQITSPSNVSVHEMPPCTNTKATGLVQCSWPAAFSVTIPKDAVSGLYIVRIVRQDHIGALIPIVVKDERQADLYFQSSVTTAQAYNNWGGEGLYSDSHDGLGFATSVSFDRPYDSDFGSGQILRYEALMARFLERNGYDVSYTTNLDVAREGAHALVRRGAFLSVGHDEYWDGDERDAVQAARDVGMPAYFFGANAAYWKTRQESPGVDGNSRIVTCYKLHPNKDPLANTKAATARYRDDEIGEPEEALDGTMYESWLLFGEPWTVQNAGDPLYAGTGLREGDTIAQMVGYEYDRTFNLDTPSPVTVVSHSPVVDAEGRPSFQQATYYRAPSGALVFGAGSIYYSHFVDGPLRDPRVERMTANILKMGLKLPIPPGLQNINKPGTPQADGGFATAVRTLAHGMPGPTGVAQLPDGSFVVADAQAHRIWRVDSTGAVSPYAGDGNGDGNPLFDNRPGLQVRFFQPTAVLADPVGNVYVADTHNNVIRKIANDPQHTVTTLAGAFLVGDYADGPGAQARFIDPMGMDFLDATHLVIADSGNQAIRVLDLTTNSVSTLAISHFGDDLDGPASIASFYYPTAVAVAPDQRVFFLASSTGKLKVIGADADHSVTTLVGPGIDTNVGFADGSGNDAKMQPQAGLLWNNGTLLISDSANQRLRIVTPGTDSNSTRVQTWAGTGDMASVDGAAQSASFEVPLGMAFGKDGLVYVTDGAAGTLRAVMP
ncbi:MAG TPA: N,N-dimethylformamidase beta subunit family domain-containing protein [Myxococcales bacterium]|nr:N,N-dimethylformamidase beta subunit family domain-containing protein [Myxococcales bacterium]